MDDVDKDDNDGGECEMILGDIPEVTIPSSCNNRAAKSASSSFLAERMSLKKKRVPKNKGKKKI